MHGFPNAGNFTVEKFYATNIPFNLNSQPKFRISQLGSLGEGMYCGIRFLQNNVLFLTKLYNILHWIKKKKKQQNSFSAYSTKALLEKEK